MTPREHLEYAARAMGFRTAGYNDHGGFEVPIKGFSLHRWWNPRTDQADSDRMAAKLRISTAFGVDHFGNIVIVASADLANGHTYLMRIVVSRANIEHGNNADEDVCRAVREARLLVAVEIGRQM